MNNLTTLLHYSVVFLLVTGFGSFFPLSRRLLDLARSASPENGIPANPEQLQPEIHNRVELGTMLSLEWFTGCTLKPQPSNFESMGFAPFSQLSYSSRNSFEKIQFAGLGWKHCFPICYYTEYTNPGNLIETGRSAKANVLRYLVHNSI
jgi:hypothetical protein